MEIDNNAADRALRIVALGRKNYLVPGSDRGGDRAALIDSLIGTARLNCCRGTSRLVTRSLKRPLRSREPEA